jgi:hypothetical protein
MSRTSPELTCAAARFSALIPSKNSPPMLATLGRQECVGGHRDGRTSARAECSHDGIGDLHPGRGLTVQLERALEPHAGSLPLTCLSRKARVISAVRTFAWTELV